MDSQTIRTALGKLQVEPGSKEAWESLQSSIKQGGGDLSNDELARLLDAAREKHAERGEWAAAVRLLELAIAAAEGTPRETALVREQAKLLSEKMFDEDGAAAAYLRLLELSPDDKDASAQLEEQESRRARYTELRAQYVSEAEGASDEAYKSAMLMRAAEMDVRFGSDDAAFEAAVDRLEQAVRLDPTNEPASRLLEHLYRQKERFEDVAGVLERLADRGETPASRIAAGVRLARTYAQELGDKERAARAYNGVLRDAPDHAEAKEFLSDLYSSADRWADLVALYEREVKAAGSTGDAGRVGDMLQIAMLHWKKLEKPADAEPWFERIRKVEPANPGMLSFFREYCASLNDDTRLMDVLQAAARALPEGSKERTQISAQLGKMAEGQANAQKAVEQYKSVLRQDPDNAEAREALKRLYKQTQGYNALVELLRQELERLPNEKYQERLAVLREVATVYRQYIKSDTALLSVLGQIVQLDDKLDEQDVLEMRELVALYDKLGRHRDLITNQVKLAEITPDVEEKKELYRAAARRWLDQFSNAQNATEAYAALLKVAPEDREARERLEELYRKRRAWAPLFELYAADLAQAEGQKRLPLLREMATLAAERLNRPADAIGLYQQILEIDPSKTDVLDALEKLAERNRDFVTLAAALERRVQQEADAAGKLAALQKLGTVYADHIQDAEKAVRTWRRVLEASPGHSRALRVLREAYLGSGDFDALEELYGSQNDWEGLSEVLSNAADRAKDNQAKIALSYRAARIYEEKLNQPERAFRSYDRVLSVDPSDTRAARALLPLYERDEKWARLTPLYELLFEKAETEAEKLEMLGRLVDVSGKRLGDRKAAAGYARKAYELSPDSPLSLELLEETSRAAGAWDSFVSVLETRLAALASDVTEPPPAVAAKGEPAPAGGKKKKGKKKAEATSDAPAAADSVKPATDATRRLLELKLSRVYSEELSRTDDAVKVYKQMLERDPGDADAASELEGILRRHDRRDDLRWLLELRVTSAGTDADKLRLLGEWATLEEAVFESPEAAVRLYRRMLEISATDERALSSLPRLLLAAGNAAGAAEIIAQHRDAVTGEARAEREVELAELYLERLSRPVDALESAIAGLTSDAQSARAMSVLERLVNVESVRARAADVLAQRYASGGEARREASALSVLLEQVKDPSERLALYTRLADVNEHKLGAHGSALDVMLAAVREFPAELSLWERADALASSSGRPTDLAEAMREVLRGKHDAALETELSERAARLHEDRLGDPIGATPYLERVLALSPSNEVAFQRLKDILTAAERWGELEALYDRASRATDDLARRIEMLVEVALICEEIIEDVAKATAYYERILEIDPVHDAAIRALDRLYLKQGKNRELSALLERRLETAVGDEAFELKLRLAKLQLELHQPDKAMGHVEDVLRERVGDYEARELAERMLAIGELRPRAARALETVYEARDEVRDLVRVLAIRLESLTSAEVADERRDLLRRIAMLRDDRLHDDQGALDALAELVPMDPLDGDARARLLEIGRRVSAHERVAEVLTRASQKADTPVAQGEILTAVARIYEDLLADPARAEATYRSILRLDDKDAELVLPAAKALERIYVNAGDSGKLAEMLRLQVQHEQDGNVRRELFGRLGTLSQTVLGDEAGAIAAWKSRVDENPEDAEALAALDRLYESAGRYRELVSVLQRRREGSSDVELRRSLMTREAETLWKKLDSVSEAIDAYQALVAEFGPSRDALSALEALFASAQRWEELSDTYERHLDLCDTDDERLEILAKLGDIKREHLADATGAIEVYRRALGLRSTHSASRDALSKLLESSDNATKREAALILKPIFEAENDNEKLLTTLLIEVETSDDPLDKLNGLEAAMKVAEGPLNDAQRAFALAERAVRSAVGHSDMVPWFTHLERLATATLRQAEYVKLLCDVVPEIFDGDVQLIVTLKIADLARHKLADRELARTYYKKALELRQEDKQALAALESLYEEAGDARNLLEILERRTEVAENDDERKALLFRRAKLLSEALSERRKAIEVYESILDIGLEREALSALEALYTSESMWVELVGLYERQLDAKLGDPAELHVAIARVAARHQNNVGRAFDELESALSVERQHEGAIAELERLVAEGPDPVERARAAALLEPVYLLRADFGKVMNAIRARLEASGDPDERRDLLTRLAKLYEEQKEDYRAALDTVARLLAEDPTDAGTISELERLAKVASAERRLAEIYADELKKIENDDESSVKLARRTGELFRDLNENDEALVFFRRALAFEPESKSLFQAVDQLLEKGNRAEERVELYRQGLEHCFEPAERLPLLHVMAALQKGPLGRPDDAIETYRQALEAEEGDAVSLDALTELYRQRARWDDLAELYLRRAESTSAAEQSAQYRLALAKLHQEQGQVERAIDQLQEIVTALPRQQEAIAALEQLRKVPEHTERVVDILRPLYESLDDWRRQIQLNEDRYALAQDTSDKVRVMRETAELWEKRGDDLNRARRALEAAVKLDPDDADTRAEYERLVERTGAWDALATTYERVLEENPDTRDKREILATLANVHNARRDDPRKALSAYERLFAVDENDIEPLNKMESLATLLSDWPVLVRVLTAKAELLDSDEERASVWRRVAEAKRDMLDDAPGAIAGYERALELDAESAFTVDCLIELYEAKGEAARLVELYQRRVELTEDDDDLKYTLLVSAAGCYDKQLSDKRKAIEVLEQALQVRPGDSGVLGSLNRLYRAEEMWAELLESLKLQAGSAEAPAERAQIRKEIGNILATKLDSFEDALDAYRLALQEAPGDAELVTAVREIGSGHEDLRRSVAEILVPVLEQGGRYADLVDVLEMRLTIETEPTERVQTLRTIARVLETNLNKQNDAESALLRAISERPDDAELHNELERLSRATGGFGRYADALSDRAGSTFDPEVARELFVRLGRISEQELKDEKRAVAAYKRAVEQAGDQPELLDALDRLHTRLGEHEAVAEILERRVSVESSDERQADLYYRLAQIQIAQFEEPGRGLSSLRMALERVPAHEAAVGELEKLVEHDDLFEEVAEVLESVYRSRGLTDRLAKLYEKRVGFADSVDARIDMRRSLARVLEEEGKDPRAAQRVIELGLAEAPEDSALLEEIERLAPITGEWDKACQALSSAIAVKHDLTPESGVALSMRLAGWYRDKASDNASAETALKRALEFDPSNDEVLQAIEQLQRAPGREADLFGTLRKRAKLQVDESRREELYRQAKALAEGTGDLAAAEAVLRELLAQDDTNLWALAELCRLREAAGDYAETFKLTVRQADLSEDGASVRALRRRAAEIARDRLNDVRQATVLFEQLFEDEPNDKDAAAALRALYASAERHQDLGTLLERLVDMAESPSARTVLRLELAQLNRDKFEAMDTAIEHLRAILEEEPGQSEAVVALSELYEKTQRDEELAELLSTQISAARDRGDTTSELRFQVRLGEVYDGRLGDKARAIDTYRGVLERDANHQGALEALARLYKAQNDLASAADVLSRLLDVATGPAAVALAIELGESQQKLGSPEQAARAFERGLSHDESNTELRDRLRVLYQAEKSWEKLSTLLSRDAELSPKPEEAVKILQKAARIQSKERADHVAAAELLERASKLKPDDREILLELCDEYSASGRGKAAAEVLQRIVESFGTKRTKELGEIHRRLAAAYLADNEVQKALEELDKAFRIEPGNINVLTLLGNVAMQVGDHKKAQQMYRALLLQKLDDANGPIKKSMVFFRLGQIHEQLDEKPKALQMYERAVQTDGLEDAKARIAALKG
ncbi:MAG TPA: tetratricopeptide repeat protein [Polyangiaceae bacterium]|nr:tetratricopeptide repeat protein [Polyangiaceae bacterium]